MGGGVRTTAKFWEFAPLPPPPSFKRRGGRKWKPLRGHRPAALSHERRECLVLGPDVVQYGL